MNVRIPQGKPQPLSLGYQNIYTSTCFLVCVQTPPPLYLFFGFLEIDMWSEITDVCCTDCVRMCSLLLAILNKRKGRTVFNAKSEVLLLHFSVDIAWKQDIITRQRGGLPVMPLEYLNFKKVIIRTTRTMRKQFLVNWLTSRRLDFTIQRAKARWSQQKKKWRPKWRDDMERIWFD